MLKSYRKYEWTRNNGRKSSNLSNLWGPISSRINSYTKRTKTISEFYSICAKLVNQRIIQVIQLHGAEDEATIRHYQQTLKIPVIKAFGIQTPDDVKKAIQSSADYLLFDYKVAGSGKTFDWRYIQEVKHDYFLAGGINSENLKDALSLNPYAINLSSAIETNGRKDNQKMTTIINIMRGWRQWQIQMDASVSMAVNIFPKP